MARSKGKIMVTSAPDLAGSTLTCDVCNAVLLIEAHLQAVYVKRLHDAEARVEYLEAKLAGFDSAY